MNNQQLEQADMDLHMLKLYVSRAGVLLHLEHSNLSVELTDRPVHPVIMSARRRGINRVSSNDKVRPVMAWPIRCWGGGGWVRYGDRRKEVERVWAAR